MRSRPAFFAEHRERVPSQPGRTPQEMATRTPLLTSTGIFTRDPAAIAVGDEYLRILSWSFVASGIIFVAGSMFQAMGNTVPSIFTSVVRIVVVAIPVVVLARRPGFELATIWRLATIATWVQLAAALGLLGREYGRRLRFLPGEPPGEATEAAGYRAEVPVAAE